MVSALHFGPIVHNSPAYREMVDFRLRLLRAPLGFSFSEEQLAAEAETILLGGWMQERLVTCLVLLPVDARTVKFRQMAVEEGLQGRGIGQQMMAYAEEEARKRGFTHVTLNARETALPFYQKLGYVTEGERFIELTIPHWKMGKSLAKSLTPAA